MGNKTNIFMPRFKSSGDFNYEAKRAVYGAFKQPKGSLVSKAVNKINDYEKNEIVKYNYAISILMKRVIAVAMPIFSLLDMICYGAKSLGKVVVLKPTQALYNLSKCAKCFQIFLISIFAIPFALISPTSIYRTCDTQVETLQKRLTKKMLEKINHSDTNEGIKEKLITYAKKYLSEKKNKEFLELMVNELTDSKTIKSSDETETKIPALLPPHEDTRREVILDEYIKLYAYIISYCVTEKVNLDKGNNDFYNVFMDVLAYKNPEKRHMIMASLLKRVRDKRELMPKISKKANEQVKSYHTLPLFTANLITNNEMIINRLVGVLNGSFFNNQRNFRISELTSYLQQIHACNIPDELKQKALEVLIQHFESAEEVFEKEKLKKKQEQEEAQKFSKDVEALSIDLNKAEAELKSLVEEKEFYETLYTNLNSTEKKEEREQFIKKAEEECLVKSLQKLKENKNIPPNKVPFIEGKIKKENEKLFAEIRKNDPKGKRPRQVTNLDSKLRRAESKVTKLKERISAHQEKNKNESVGIETEDPVKYVNNGTKNLTMLLSLNDKVLIESIFNEINIDGKYPNLGSKNIVSDLFRSTFKLEGIDSETLYDSLEHLRSPAALIKFHNRIKKYPSKQRDAIIQTSRSIVDSIISGKFWQNRHNTEGNPHLNRVFEGRPELQQQWCTPEETSVGELISDVNNKYANSKAIDATDPTDIYKVGDDLNTCVCLDGRLIKIIGMLGLVKDGKNHSLLIKSNGGDTLAETQLQLLWDKKNNKPVLYLEEVNYVGKNENDHTLEGALINFAITKARKMGLDLVSQWNSHDKGKSILGDEYTGTVSSLGSSSPIEFVNTLHKNFTGPYNMGKCYIVYKHSAS